jgi:fido (protein-threonine AMPylation protein)
VDNEIVFAGDLPSQTISDRVRRGTLRQLARGIYTTDDSSSPEAVVARRWHTIVGHEFPNAVITDRSALTGGKIDGFLYLAHDARQRELALPALLVLARRGAGPLGGDLLLPGGLYQASRARALAENMQRSRAREGRPRRTLDDHELDAWVERLCRIDGEERLAEYWGQAERLGPQLGVANTLLAQLGRKIGAAIGTQQIATSSRALAARQAGLPFDPDRIERFDRLVVALRSAAPQSRRGLDPGSPSFAVQAFYEAYFSNHIEGTIFTVGEAKAIVYDGAVPSGRAADSHDVVGTYQIVVDHDEMSRIAASAGQLLSLLQSRHATLMGGRPEIAGLFKATPNQAGQTLFVDPALVDGTLREGWHRLAELDTAWERAVYMMFLVSEVHPFVDGNGRMARVMMNCELVARGQSKIIVPTGFRSEYLGALRRLSRDDDPSVFIKAMRFLQDHVSQVDWATDETAEAGLRATNAFEEEEEAPRVRLLRPVAPES